jgi:hypothetical protein
MSDATRNRALVTDLVPRSLRSGLRHAPGDAARLCHRKPSACACQCTPALPPHDLGVAVEPGWHCLRSPILEAHDSPAVRGFRSARGSLPPEARTPDAKSRDSKKARQHNCLQSILDHARVLFVQHTSKNAGHCRVLERSFIARSGVLGNCLGATEGGIPRSSRYRWFA